MKILMVSVNKEKSIRPVLPIGMVAVATQLQQQGYEVDCLDLCFVIDDEKAIKKRIGQFQPDVIGISIRNIDSQSYLEPVFYSPLVLEISNWIREVKKDIKIVLGGPGFSQIPEEMMDYTQADYGVVALGEHAAPELMHCIKYNKSVEHIDGVIYRNGNGKFVLNPPSFELDYQRIAPINRGYFDRRYYGFEYQTQQATEKCVEPVLTKRGCVLECIFCSNFKVDGAGVRLRPVEETVDEIELICKESEADGFEIVDGVFNLPLRHALSILKEMEKRKINKPWTCMLNPSTVTEELAELLVKTGCNYIEFGTDSASDPILRVLKKQFQSKHIINAHRIIESVGIEIMHCVFIGSPYDNAETVRETFDVMDSLVPDKSNINSHAFYSLGLRICKNSELHQYALQHGLVNKHSNLGVPHFYISPEVSEDSELLNEIEQRVVNNQNWYLWWGLPNISLKERIEQVKEQHKKTQELYHQVVGFH